MSDGNIDNLVLVPKYCWLLISVGILLCSTNKVFIVHQQCWLHTVHFSYWYATSIATRLIADGSLRLERTQRQLLHVHQQRFATLPCSPMMFTNVHQLCLPTTICHGGPSRRAITGLEVSPSSKICRLRISYRDLFRIIVGEICLGHL